MSTLTEPVGPEDLARLNGLNGARRNIADKLLQLEMEKIRILAASKRVDDEWSGLFQRLAQERGLDPTTILDINPQTGELQSAPEGGGTEPVTSTEDTPPSSE